MIIISDSILDSGTVNLVVEGHLDERDIGLLREQLIRYRELQMRVVVDVQKLRHFDTMAQQRLEMEGDIEWIGLPYQNHWKRD